ncbi:MAG: A24 family peptidase [Lachnospiraceae bacterium]|nr:A24 family peptidase [Lachnospiraceae bacterium]
MNGIKLAAVGLLLSGAVYTDIKKGKIKNGHIMTGLIAGLLCAYGIGGMGEVWLGIKTAAVLFPALFFLYVIKGLGAGDGKLLLVLAVFYPERIPSIVVLSFFTGAVLAVGRMSIRWIRKYPFYIKKETLHFSIPVAISTLLIMGLGDII